MDHDSIEALEEELAFLRRCLSQCIEVLDSFAKRLELMRRPSPNAPHPESTQIVGRESARALAPISQKDAIIKVLIENNGPIHGKSLWRLMQDMGARSAAKDPLSNLDAKILQLRENGVPIVNHGLRMYEWIGERRENPASPVQPPAIRSEQSALSIDDLHELITELAGP